MTTIVTTVTPDHRYFMRKTKREIVNHIEMLTGAKYSIAEYRAMQEQPKDQLATLAMNAYRALPPAPADPTATADMVRIICAELNRQSEASGPTPYVDLRVTDHAKLDGFFDLRALAETVIRETRR